MISLSYTTMNALIHEPHTWLCKQMGLKTFSNQYMEEGKATHQIVQEHVSGVKAHELLKDLPLFSIVEKVQWDDNCRVKFKINDKYEFNGFVDGLNPFKKEILEIKTGKAWSPGDFSRLVQWKLYGLGLKDYKKIWLVNVPRNPDEWMPQTIRIFNTNITEKNIQEAQDFIEKALYIIAHIKEQQLEVPQRSKWCYYSQCPWCQKYD